MTNKITRRASLAAASAVTLVALTTPGAMAQGRSPWYHNCYSTWGQTGASTHCVLDNHSIRVRTHLDCAYQSDKTSGWVYVAKRTKVTFNGPGCRWKANSAHPEVQILG